MVAANDSICLNSSNKFFDLLSSFRDLSNHISSNTERELLNASLDEYFIYVSKTGRPLFEWDLIQNAFLYRLEKVMLQTVDLSPFDQLPPQPNTPHATSSELIERIMNCARQLPGIPFTIQRLCELILDPKKHYKRSDKFLRAIEKNIQVVTTVGPDGKRNGLGAGISSPPHLMNGDASIDPFLENGSSNDCINDELLLPDLLGRREAGDTLLPSLRRNSFGDELGRSSCSLEIDNTITCDQLPVVSNATFQSVHVMPSRASRNNDMMTCSFVDSNPTLTANAGVVDQLQHHNLMPGIETVWSCRSPCDLSSTLSSLPPFSEIKPGIINSTISSSTMSDNNKSPVDISASLVVPHDDVPVLSPSAVDAPLESLSPSISACMVSTWFQSGGSPQMHSTVDDVVVLPTNVTASVPNLADISSPDLTQMMPLQVSNAPLPSVETAFSCSVAPIGTAFTDVSISIASSQGISHVSTTVSTTSFLQQQQIFENDNNFLSSHDTNNDNLMYIKSNNDLVNGSSSTTSNAHTSVAAGNRLNVDFIETDIQQSNAIDKVMDAITPDSTDTTRGYCEQQEPPKKQSRWDIRP